MAPRFNKENFHKNLELVDAITKISEKKGCTSGQLVLAWLMSQGDDIIPIPGTTKIKNLDENIGALKVQISKEEDREIRQLIGKADVKGDRYPAAFASGLFVDTVPLKK
jgi:aryl-alcohol dehydrogenase-like predicted oxidoreductase